jgi:prevent-host-death family protein
MTMATIFEARNNFSQVLKRVAAGETITITSGRAKKPVAKLVPLVERKIKRLGFMEHLKISIPDSFFEPLPEEELRLWNGEEQ